MAVDKKKKICIVVPAHWEHVMGGSQYQAKMLIDHLINTENYEIYYLTRGVNNTFSPQNYKIIQIADPNGIRRYGEFLDVIDLYKVLKTISPDYIYQRVGCGYTGITAFYAKKHKIRCVWHVAHDKEVMPYKISFSLNMAFRYADKVFLEYGVRNSGAIVTQTKQQADLLWKYYNIKPDAIISNSHPMPEEKVKINNPIQVAWVANIKKWKRPEIILKLARDLSSRENLRFIMIGKALDKPKWCLKIKEEADKLDNLEYLGGQSQEFVNETLANSHIFINTSKQEGFANTFIQSWLRKVPVLSLTVNPDGVFDDCKMGICSETYQELKSNLEKLLDDSKLRNEMGVNAFEYAKKKHSFENMLELEKIITNS